MQLEFISGIDISEAIWRNHYQIVVSKKNDTEGTSPVSFGSAFMFIYKDRRWLITADHVIHPDKHGILNPKDCLYDDDKKLIPQEFNYFLINNVNVPNKLQTIFTSLSGFFFFDEIEDPTSVFTKEELEELEMGGISLEDFIDRIDIAFCEITSQLNPSCFTHELCDKDGNIVVPKGLKKLMLSEENIANPKNDTIYSAYGVVHNDIEDGVRFLRVNAPYSYINFVEEKDGLFKFQFPGNIIYEDWAALSGCALFDMEGNIVGMIIRVVEKENFIWVVPIKKILRLLDYATSYEENINK